MGTELYGGMRLEIMPGREKAGNAGSRDIVSCAPPGARGWSPRCGGQPQKPLQTHALLRGVCGWGEFCKEEAKEWTTVLD